MITPELIAYIKSQHEQGIVHEQIVAALRGAGWMEDDIMNGFNTAIPQPVIPTVTTVPVQEIIQPIIQADPVQSAITTEPVQEMRPVMTQSFQSIETQRPIQFAQPVVLQEPAQLNAQQQPVVQVQNPVMAQSFQAQPVMQAMPMQSYNTMSGAAQPVVHKNRTPLLIGIIAILALLVGGLSYAYYAGYFTPLEKTTAQAFESIYSAKSASFDVTTTIDLSDAAKSTTDGLATLSGGVPVNKVSITTKGMYDLSDINNEKLSTTISVGAGSMDVDAELRYLNKTLYAQLTKIPAATFIPTLASFTNQWIAFPITGDASVFEGTPLSGLPGVDPNILSSLTAEQKLHLYDLAKNAQFITITKKESPEEINGKLAYHFYFDLNRNGIAEYLKEVENYIHQIGKNDSKLSAFNAESSIKGLNSIQNFVGEAWIGKADKLLAKTNINFLVITLDNNVQSTTKVGITGLFDKWNEPVMITTPESSKTIEEIMKDMYADIQDGTSSDPIVQASLDEANKKADETKRKSLVTNQRALAELYFDENKSYSGFCNSKDNPVQDGISCVSVKSGFFAFTDLENGKFFCADATGFAGEVSTEPKTGSTCPKK